MAEYIERDALLGSIGLIKLHFVAHGDNKSLYDIINEQPAADVAPVVRCKDCKNYGVTAYGNMCKCWADWIPTEDDDFCSYGKRRADK